MDPSKRAAPAANVTRPTRRAVVGAAASAAIVPFLPASAAARKRSPRRAGGPVLIGSGNALAGMRKSLPALAAGGDPLDAVLETVKVVEADPNDNSVGLGGLPDEMGRVTLDAACMYGPTHNSGAVAAIENILHPCEVARLVMERTDHCLLVGRGAYEFARAHGHPHVDLLTEKARRIWMRWKEGMSDRDDRLPEPPKEGEKHGMLGGASEPRVAELDPASPDFPRHGTVHCSGLSVSGELACTTTTSGLAFKIPGRVGDSPIIGAGLYCDQEAGSAGSTGRGEAAILSNGSFAIVELLRQGMAPVDAGLEVLRRIGRQVERQAKWQPGLLGEDGRPSFSIRFYVLGVDGRHAGVILKGAGEYAVADAEEGARLEPLVPLYE
jgi:N4-(beta-N-acetylglucosaminyl)-L-asparaginase